MVCKTSIINIRRNQRDRCGNVLKNVDLNKNLGRGKVTDIRLLLIVSDLQIFFTVCKLFLHSLNRVFCGTKLYILMKSNLSVFLFVCGLCI